MVNNKGFLKVVEATIAVMLIFGTLLWVTSKTMSGTEGDLGVILNPILKEIADNSSLRLEIIKNSSNVLTHLENFVEQRIDNPSLNYSVVRCELNEPCSLGFVPSGAKGDIFASGKVFFIFSKVILFFVLSSQVKSAVSVGIIYILIFYLY